VRRLLVVLLLVTTPLLVMWWLATAPSFALREVRPVESPEGPLRRVPADFIETRLEPLLGVNLFRLSLEEVQRRLDHPWVAGVAVGKELPGALRVTLVERQPVALAEAAEGFWYLDAEGHPIARCCETEAPPSLLRVAGARSPKDFAGALQVAAEARGLGLPWSENLQRVEVLGVDNYRLDLPALPFALLVRAGSLEGKVEYLTLLFPELVARYQSIEAVDLRFRERVVVRPGEPAEPSISPVPDGQTDRG
jgi:cell division protein FtsQ